MRKKRGAKIMVPFRFLLPVPAITLACHHYHVGTSSIGILSLIQTQERDRHHQRTMCCSQRRLNNRYEILWKQCDGVKRFYYLSVLTEEKFSTVASLILVKLFHLNYQHDFSGLMVQLFECLQWPRLGINHNLNILPANTDPPRKEKML